MSSAGTKSNRPRALSAPESGDLGRRPNGPVFPRLVVPLALLVLAAMLSCAALGYIWAQQAETGRDFEQRLKLRTAISESLPAFRDEQGPAPAVLETIARVAGLNDLRFDPESWPAGREAQPVIDVNGRILGWLSWKPDRPATAIFGRLWPLIALSIFGFALLLTLVGWQLRRAARALAEDAARLRLLSDHDALTGLPHHRTMLSLVDRTLSTPGPVDVAAFAHMDVDGFRRINDTLGNAAGDEVLAAVADRLKTSLPEGAVGGRFGGDEFAVFIRAADEASVVAEIDTVKAALARPYWIKDRMVQIGLSAGFALVPRDGKSGDELARRAHLALQFAKTKKRSQLARFEPAMDDELADRMFVERELKGALAAGDLKLHYQPIVAANGAGMISVEALLRWEHPERGNIPPLSFVAVAEQAGLMEVLGQFVLRQALADARRWPDLSIAVNLSPVQVRDPTLVEMVARHLEESGIAPERLLLEVTEGVLIDNPAEAKTRLDALRALGIRLALDDFGTGYSSLAYLQNFKFDKLKIDKSFVQPLGRNGNSAAMIQAIVALGRALGMSVLVEGVETEEQRVLLRLAGCDEMQGYLFARPMPREGIDSLLLNMRNQPAKAAGRQP